MATILSCNATGTFSAVLTGGILSTSSRLFVVFFFLVNLLKYICPMWSVNSIEQDQKAILIVKKRGLPLSESLLSPSAFRHIRVSSYLMLQENVTGHVSVLIFLDSQLSV